MSTRSSGPSRASAVALRPARARGALASPGRWTTGATCGRENGDGPVAVDHLDLARQAQRERRPGRLVPRLPAARQHGVERGPRGLDAAGGVLGDARAQPALRSARRARAPAPRRARRPRAPARRRAAASRGPAQPPKSPPVPGEQRSSPTNTTSDARERPGTCRAAARSAMSRPRERDRQQPDERPDAVEASSTVEQHRSASRGRRRASPPASSRPARGPRRRAASRRRFATAANASQPPRRRGGRRTGETGDSGRKLAARPDGDAGQRDDVGQELMVEVDEAQDQERGDEQPSRRRRCSVGPCSSGEPEPQQPVRGLDRGIAPGDRRAAVAAAPSQQQPAEDGHVVARPSIGHRSRDSARAGSRPTRRAAAGGCRRSRSCRRRGRAGTR